MRYAVTAVVLFMLWQVGIAALVAREVGAEITADFAPLHSAFASH